MPVLFAICSPQFPVFVAILFGLPAIVSSIVTTFLGVGAISDIRRSKGRLTGLGLAFFDAVFFPTLIVNMLIAGVGLVFMKMGIGMSELLILVIIAVPIIMLANVLLLRWLWQSVRRS